MLTLESSQNVLIPEIFHQADFAANFSKQSLQNFCGCTGQNQSPLIIAVEGRSCFSSSRLWRILIYRKSRNAANILNLI